MVLVNVFIMIFISVSLITATVRDDEKLLRAHIIYLYTDKQPTKHYLRFENVLRKDTNALYNKVYFIDLVKEFNNQLFESVG